MQCDGDKYETCSCVNINCMPKKFDTKLLATKKELRVDDPRKHLWAAVLGRAVDDLKSKNQLQRSSAEYWLRNRKKTGPGSYLWVCDVLDVDADRMMKIAFNRKKKVGSTR